jgi:hypothetical protein
MSSTYSTVEQVEEVVFRRLKRETSPVEEMLSLGEDRSPPSSGAAFLRWSPWVPWVGTLLRCSPIQPGLPGRSRRLMLRGDDA